MTKTAAQLNAEIAQALKSVSVKKLFAWRPKLEETLVDIAEGRLSHSPGKPVLVSHLDTPRGAWFVLDGHHRMVETMQAGHATIEIVLDQFVPRLERAGGAYSNYVDNKVNVYEFLQQRGARKNKGTSLEQKLRELVEHGGLYASTHDLAVQHDVSDAVILRVMKKLNAEGLIHIIEGEAGHSHGRSGTARQPKIYYWVTM